MTARRQWLARVRGRDARRERTGGGWIDGTGRDAIEVAADHRVVLRIVEQERVVSVRRDDLRVRHLVPSPHERTHDLARAGDREAPVGREADDEEATARD